MSVPRVVIARFTAVRRANAESVAILGRAMSASSIGCMTALLVGRTAQTTAVTAWH